MIRISVFSVIVLVVVAALWIGGDRGARKSETGLVAGYAMTSDTVPSAPQTRLASVWKDESMHDFHIEDLELDCTDCHHETDAAPLVTPHDEYFRDFWINCETCHHEVMGDVEAQACANCHPASTGGIADQIISEKVAIHLSCWECHESGTGVEASESCRMCHGGNQEDE